MSNNENLIRFPQKNSKKAEKALNEVSLRSQLKHAKVVVFSFVFKCRRNIFGSFRLSLEGFGKLSEILGRHWDVFENHTIMARRKSHACDPTFVKVYLFNKALLSMIFQITGDFFQ